MDIKNIFKTDYLDIIFYGKNKKYGGYELRKKYNSRMLTGGLVSVALFSALFGSTMIDFSKDDDVIIEDIVVDKTIVMAEPPPLKPDAPPPPPAPVAPPPVKPQVKFTPPKIEPNEKVTKEDKPEPPKDTKTVAGPRFEEGSLDAGAADPSLTPGGTGTGDIGTPVVEPPKKDTGPVRTIANKPEFPGNLQKWLADNIRYPDVAAAEGIQGQVIVEFVVGEDGSVRDAKVLRGLGGGLNNEALRVVKSMPKWKPGHQNGEKKAVYYTLPITFRLQ